MRHILTAIFALAALTVAAALEAQGQTLGFYADVVVYKTAQIQQSRLRLRRAARTKLTPSRRPISQAC